VSWLARLPTGAKLFMILSFALLPLALIAIGATLQTTRLADAEARARLRVAADESAHAIGIELVGDMTALRVALNALGNDPADAPSCARAQGIFAQQSASGTRFLIADRAGRPLCGQPLAAPHVPVARGAPVSAQIAPARGLILAISGPANTTAQAYFPVAFLARLGTPSTRATLYGSTLQHGDDQLPLAQLAGTPGFNRSEATVTPIGIAGLTLRTTVRGAPITSSLIVALLLPLLMWAAAASIAWFVVDRLLIRPLRQLRGSVAAFTPGEVIDPGVMRALPAQEIRELGDTFRAISRTVALHEAGLAEGLVRQTKLTREVHHRVKNNLQVIASLINFHARGAPSADATAAYGSIQRRVDALAVVHRNHFADVEENRGLDLRAMIGELATGLRSSSDRQHGLAITLDVEPFLVTQDVAVAVAFLVTEIVELAMASEPGTQVRVALRGGEEEGRAVLRVVSRALIERDELRELVATRYGRVMEGLARQLRAKLHHDPLVGAYEITIAVLGRA
jgi:two-component sensor histidine kinase